MFGRNGSLTRPSVSVLLVYCTNGEFGEYHNTPVVGMCCPYWISWISCGVVCVCGDDDEGYMNLPIIRVFRGEEAGYNVEACPICVPEDDGDDCDCAMYELLSCGGYDDFTNLCVKRYRQD